VHHAVLVDDLAVTHDELVGVDDDRGEVVVVVEAELEDRQRRERGDAHAHRLVYAKADGRLEAFLVQEQQRDLTEPLHLRRRQAREHRRRGKRAVPQLIGNRLPRENSPASPILEHDERNQDGTKLGTCYLFSAHRLRAAGLRHRKRQHVPIFRRGAA
jgi:hypothetical protein